MLDTNFVLTCIKQKVDFIDQFQVIGAEIVVPEEVIIELEKITGMKEKKGSDRDAAKLALSVIESEKFEKIRLNNRDVDKGLIRYAKENKDFVIATLDRGIKKKAGRVAIIKDRKIIGIV